MTVPDACCLRLNATVLLDEGCPADPTPTNAYLEGCGARLATSATPALAVSVAVVVIFQVAGVILSCCLGCHVEDKREWYEMTSL